MAVPLEKFVELLEDSGILAGDTLQDFLPPKREPKTAEELALELVRQKKLTRFQAEEVSKGKGKSLTLGNYVLMEKIGAGGMGQVFKARHRRMNRLVAVKLLPSAMTKNKEAIARFEREVQAAAKLRHTNIVAADDADEANGVHFLVMELVEGSDLSALVKKKGPVSIEKAVNYIVQAAKGLEFAHKKGVIHRDIKPANLLLDREGTIKILDMGLARIHGGAGAQAELTATGAVMGTVDYMAPEQALSTKTADARADIYSLGCSLFYVLTGKATYDGETLMAKLLAHRDQPIPDLRAVCPEVPYELDAIFKKMVAKRVEDRYQSMHEVIVALESRDPVRERTIDSQQLANSSTDTGSLSFLRGISLAPPTPVCPKKKMAWPFTLHGKEKKKWLLIGGGLLGVVVLLAGVILSFRTKDGKLIVTVNEPDAEIQVLNEENKVEITRKGDKGPITISVDPGKHRLKVQKDGFELFTEKFEIESRGEKSITARLVPVEGKPAVLPIEKMLPGVTPQSTVPVASNRRAAEQLFPDFASLTVRLQSGKEVTIGRENKPPLPDEPFELIGLDFFGMGLPPGFTSKVLLPAIAGLPSLNSISNLWEGSFTTAELASLAESPSAANLKEFVVGYCDLSPENLDLLKKFPRLERIGLRATRPTAELFTRLNQDHAGLRFLGLCDLGIDQAPDEPALKAFAGLPVEQVTILHEGAIDRRVCQSIASLPNLKALDIKVRKLNDEAAAELGRCPRLEKLWLPYTSVTDQVLPALDRLEKLIDLNVYSTKITDPELRKFAQKHPKCTIITAALGLIGPSP